MAVAGRLSPLLAGILLNLKVLWLEEVKALLAGSLHLLAGSLHSHVEHTGSLWPLSCFTQRTGHLLAAARGFATATAGSAAAVAVLHSTLLTVL